MVEKHIDLDVNAYQKKILTEVMLQYSRDIQDLFATVINDNRTTSKKIQAIDCLLTVLKEPEILIIDLLEHLDSKNTPSLEQYRHDLLDKKRSIGQKYLDFLKLSTAFFENTVHSRQDVPERYAMMNLIHAAFILKQIQQDYLNNQKKGKYNPLDLAMKECQAEFSSLKESLTTEIESLKPLVDDIQGLINTAIDEDISLLSLKKRLKSLQKHYQTDPDHNGVFFPIIRYVGKIANPSQSKDNAVKELETLQSLLKSSHFEHTHLTLDLDEKVIQPLLTSLDRYKDLYLKTYRQRKKIFLKTINSATSSFSPLDATTEAENEIFDEWRLRYQKQITEHGLSIARFFAQRSEYGKENYYSDLQKTLHKIVVSDIKRHAGLVSKKQSLGHLNDINKECYLKMIGNLNYSDFTPQEMSYIKELISTQNNYQSYLEALSHWKEVKEHYADYSDRSEKESMVKMIKSCLYYQYLLNLSPPQKRKLLTDYADLLEFCLNYKIKPKTFHRGLSILFDSTFLKEIKTESNLPDIKRTHHDGKTNLSFELISHHDLKTLYWGDLIGSCMHIGGASAKYVLNVLRDPNAGLYLIKDATQVNAPKAIGLIYSWINPQTNNLVFDSIEILAQDKISEYSSSVAALLRAVSDEITITQSSHGIDRIMVGLGGLTQIVFNKGIEASLSPEVKPIVEGQIAQHRDSFSQFCLAESPIFTRKKEEIIARDLGKTMKIWLDLLGTNSKNLNLFKKICDEDSSDEIFAFLKYMMMNDNPQAEQFGLKQIIQDLFNTYDHQKNSFSFNPIGPGNKKSLFHWLFAKCYEDYQPLMLRLAGMMTQQDINHPDNAGVTAVHLAAYYGYTDILKILIQRGGNPHLKDLNNKSAFDYALEYDTKLETIFLSGYSKKEKNIGEEHLTLLKRRKTDVQTWLSDVYPSEMPDLYVEKQGLVRHPSQLLFQINRGSPVSVKDLTDHDDMDLEDFFDRLSKKK